MSIGIGAFAKLCVQDDTSVAYEYGDYNLNDPQYRNQAKLSDGCITINKQCFVNPDVHVKIKRMPNGKKKVVTKRIPVQVDYHKMIEMGLITVENCSNCWKTTEWDNHVDVMACHLLDKILRQYQEADIIPEYINYDV